MSLRTRVTAGLTASGGRLALVASVPAGVTWD